MAHEDYIKKEIEAKNKSVSLIQYHQKRIEWLQHERMVHLIIFITTIIALIGFVMAAMYSGELLLYGGVILLIIVTFFYCLHYYYLENTVQRWYDLCDRLEKVDDN
jgi:hypothetical protein